MATHQNGRIKSEVNNVLVISWTKLNLPMWHCYWYTFIKDQSVGLKCISSISRSTIEHCSDLNEYLCQSEQ